jgi:hypothetical protein
MSDAATAPDNQIGQLHADRDIERLALAAADALQRLVAERHAFRSHAGAQERELMRLRATDEELRRQITLIRESYMRLGLNSPHSCNISTRQSGKQSKRLRDPRSYARL